jgi:Flp pilus assembly protein TadG
MIVSARHSRNVNRGAAVPETAIVLSVTLALLLGVFEYGRIFMIRQILDNAVREGARAAIVGTASTPPVTTDQLIGQVQGFLAGQSLENVNVQVYLADPATGENIGAWDSASYGAAIAVQIDADYEPILPTSLGILPSPLHLSAVSIMLSEAN